MRPSYVIGILLILLVVSIRGVNQLNQYAHQKKLFPQTRNSSSVILPGTPPQFQKNKHVIKEITQKKDRYHIKYAFQDHQEIPRIWSVTFPLEQTEETIAMFGVDPSVFEPVPNTTEALTKYYNQIDDGLFMEHKGKIFPSLNALSTHYGGFTQPIADYTERVLGPNSGIREQIEFVLKFCQDLPYGIPPEYFNGKFIGEMFSPPQTLLNMFGDCDSKAVLFTSTLSQLGIDDMLYIQVPGHLFVGVAGLPRPYDIYIPFMNKKYIFAEPVGPGRLSFGEQRQHYANFEGVRIFKMSQDANPVPFEFIELSKDDPFYLSVLNASITSLSIDPDSAVPTSVFGNQATDTQGQLSVWINSPDFGEVTVSINNEEIGTITRYFDEAPSCGQIGTLSAVRSPGSYPFSAESATSSWSGIITVSAGSCLMLEIGN